MSKWAFRLSGFFDGLVFYAPVALLLRTSKGLTESDFFILQALISIWTFLFEIPTSYLSDKFGHKKCLVLAAILSVICKIIFLLANNFILFALESVVEGIMYTLTSGTFTAYLYNITAGKNSNGDENAYIKESSVYGSFNSAGFLLSTALFPFLNKIMDINGLILLTLCAQVITLVLFIISPTENTVKKVENEESLRLIQIIKSVKGPLGKVLLIDSLFSFTFVVVNFMYVEKLIASGIDVGMISLVIIVYTCLGFLDPVIAQLLNKKNKTVLYFISSMLSAVLFVVLALPITNIIIVIGSMMLIPFISGITSLIHGDVENKYIDYIGYGERRATALSITSMGSNLLEVVLLVASSFLLSLGVGVSFYISAVMFLLIAILGTMLCKQMLKCTS